MTDNPVTGGRLLQDDKSVADVATIRWTFADGKQMAWTGWLTLADKARPVAASRLTCNCGMAARAQFCSWARRCLVSRRRFASPSRHRGAGRRVVDAAIFRPLDLCWVAPATQLYRQPRGL